MPNDDAPRSPRASFDDVSSVHAVVFTRAMFDMLTENPRCWIVVRKGEDEFSARLAFVFPHAGATFHTTFCATGNPKTAVLARRMAIQGERTYAEHYAPDETP